VIVDIRRTALSMVAASSLSLASFAANAVSLQLEVLLNGSGGGVFTGVQLGCADVVGTPTANCLGAGAQVGGSEGISLDSWNLFLDEDPVVSGTVAVTNTGLVTQQFTLIFTLPISPAIPGGTVIGGSIQGGVTDNNGNGATLSTATGSAFYTALIDAVAVQTLYTHLSSVTAGSFLSNNLPNVAFGTPIPSQAGPAALSTIGIKLDFLLTPGDSASFTSVFVVQPAIVPVPAAAWLFGSALGLVGVIRRRAA
jgi:hypothetical protein